MKNISALRENTNAKPRTQMLKQQKKCKNKSYNTDAKATTQMQRGTIIAYTFGGGRFLPFEKEV